MSEKAINILLVEDNPGDVRLALEALKEYNIQNRLSIVGNGEDALAYMRKQGQYASASSPDLVLLDVNLPKLDGREVFSEMRSDPELAGIPVVVLTGSKADEQILRRYGLSADCFVIKPLTIERYLEAVKCVPEFGLSFVRLAGAPGI